MNIPIVTKRRKRIEDATMAKTLVAVDQSLVETGAIEKSFLTGNAATMMSSKGSSSGSPKQPGTSWSNQGGTSSRLIARVTQNLSEGFSKAPEELELAMAEQGLSWGPPFPPGRPLDPFFGYRSGARTWDYSVGENVQLTPRWNRVSFPTIKAIYEAYDVAQICVRHLINDVRSLDFNWEPLPGVKDDVTEDIDKAIAFFDSPDKRQPFRTWLAEWLQDVLRFDAGALYVRRNEAGDPIALEVVSGETIIPLIDFYGRRPEDEDDDNVGPEGLFGGDITPAYVQIIEGLPWDWLTADDLIYQPWNPLPESQYGLAPLEAVLLSANTDVRFQWHFLQFFTEGTLPAGFMEAPPDMSDPAQLASWQETWDAVMQGDQSKLRQIRWVPNGAKFTAAKANADQFNAEFPLYLMRRTCASFGVTPNDLGFTENVNRATGDTQIDVQFRVGTSPLLRYCEDVINLFVRQHLKLRCRIRFDDGKETEDRVATATADGIYLDHGVIGIDEVRAELGKPIDKSKPSPRYINNSRTGPIPLLALESMSGKVDADTYGVADEQELIDTPYIPPPGVIPAAGTEELKGASEASARAANAMRSGTPDVGSTGEEDPNAADVSEAEEPTELEKTLALIDALLAKTTSTGATDNTGGPGVKGPATTINGGTDGITVPTGVQGSDLLEDDEDDDEDDDAIKAAQVALSVRRWRENSRNRLRKGKAPRQFVDPLLPQELHDRIWKELRGARSREEVDRAFQKLGKASAGDGPATGTPGFHRQTDAIVDYYVPLLAKAMGESLSLSDVEASVRRTLAKKSEQPPNLRPAEDLARSCGMCKMFVSDSPDGDEGLCTGYGNEPVASYQTCDAWTPLLAKEAAPNLDAELRAQVRASSVEAVLQHLRGDAAIQGTLEAAVASSGVVDDTLQCLVNQLPDDYWDRWEPGFGKAAEIELERGADDRIAGMTDSALERLTNVIAEGLDKGDSIQTTAKAAMDELGSLSRAELIVNTEYAQSMTESNLRTYAENGVEKLEWLAEGDACAECEENADASPIPAGDEWPNGDVPVHPNCRCAIAPVVGEDEVEKALSEEHKAKISASLRARAKGASVESLYRDKVCPVVEVSLPPGAEGNAAEVVDRTAVDQKSALERYHTSSASTNEYLRRGTVRSPGGAPVDLSEYDRQVKALDDAVASGRVSQAKLYRGVREGVSGVQDLKVGDVFTDPAFTSTTSKASAAKEFGSYQLTIEVPRGSRGLELAKVLPDSTGIKQEAEVLLPRGSRFRVKSVVGKKIVVELIGA